MKLLATHTFNYIVLMVKFGRTSCEDIPPALVVCVVCMCMRVCVYVCVCTPCSQTFRVKENLLNHTKFSLEISYFIYEVTGSGWFYSIISLLMLNMELLKSLLVTRGIVSLPQKCVHRN